jgi:hypothetical protein
VRPVFQTRFGRPLGNCWAASIASILELPLEIVDWSPNMTADEIEPPPGGCVSPEWIARQDRRLRELGYWMARQPWTPDLVPPEGVHYLALGITWTGVGHVCVFLEGALVHDPNPKAPGLGKVDEVAFLVRR